MGGGIMLEIMTGGVSFKKPILPVVISDLTSLPELTRYPGRASIGFHNEEIYLMGGNDATGDLNSFFALNPTTGATRQLTSLGGTFASAGGIALQNRFISVGGVLSGNHSPLIRGYDYVTNSWTTEYNLQPDIGYGWVLAKMALVGDLLYITGGTRASGAEDNTLIIYNVVTKTRVSKVTLGFNSHGSTVIAKGKYVYFLGGYIRSTGKQEYHKKAWRLDTTTGVYTGLPDLLYPHSQQPSAIWNDRIYLLASLNTSGQTVAKIQIFDPSTSKWVEKDYSPLIPMNAAEGVSDDNGNTYVPYPYNVGTVQNRITRFNLNG